MGSAGFLSFALMIFGVALFIGRFAAWIGGGSVVEAVVRIEGNRIVVRDGTELG